MKITREGLKKNIKETYNFDKKNSLPKLNYEEIFTCAVLAWNEVTDDKDKYEFNNVFLHEVELLMKEKRDAENV